MYLWEEMLNLDVELLDISTLEKLTRKILHYDLAADGAKFTTISTCHYKKIRHVPVNIVMFVCLCCANFRRLEVES